MSCHCRDRLCICPALDQRTSRGATAVVLLLCAAVYVGAFLMALAGPVSP